MARSRSMTANLSRLLSEVRAPVYVVDDQRKVVYVNAALEAWFGIDGEQLVGRRCDYASAPEDDHLSALASALCPPPAALAGHGSAATIRCPAEHGQAKIRRARFLPLGDEVECEGVLAVVAAEDADDGEATAPVDPAEHEQLHHQLAEFRRSNAGKYRLDRLIGKSAEMLRVRRQAEIAIVSQARTVVIGPPGSGREHIARLIHFGGDDARAPTLMPLACPLLDAELLQTSITAFARHVRDNPTTRPPTVLLCDVDQLSESGRTELAGFLGLPDFSLHVLATARTSLIKLAQEGAFPPLLASALSTLEIHLPPLASRRRDIPLLAQLFVEQHNAGGGSQLAGLEATALDALCEFDWDENVDQLRDIVTQACETATGHQITRDDLPTEVTQAVEASVSLPATEEPILVDDILAEVESELIRRAMRIAKGNKTQAAELLGISRPRLHRRWEELEAQDQGGSNSADGA